MKKLFILSLALMPLALFAQTAPAAPDAIDQVISIVLGICSSIPAVGPYLAIVMKILGIAAAVLTAVSACLMALSAALNVAGLTTAAGWVQKVLPYVQFASVFNVQKS